MALPDRAVETGQAQAVTLSLGSLRVQPGGVTTIPLSPEVARMIGHRHVRWEQNQRPAVLTEPMPQTRG